MRKGLYAYRFGLYGCPAEEVMGVWENLSSVLEGSIVRLAPLARRHERGLSEVARDPEVWRWSPYGAAGPS